MEFLEQPPRFLFFTGKGGVGKTSIACATAIRLAESGKRVLLVSTDPASNVGQVFGIAIGNRITPVPAVANLSALEIDPQAAAQAYRDRIVGPTRGVLAEDVVKGMEEQLSGACTTEIAAFDEFTELLVDSDLTAAYEHILFDTAPTGHTIRLLQLPGAWSGFLEAGQGDASCLGPLAGLDKQRSQYREAVEALADPRRTRLVLVARAQQATLREVARTHEELAAIGLRQQYLVVNGVLPASEGERDPLAAAVCAREQAALEAMPEALRALPCDRIALKPFNLVGLEALRQLLDGASGVTLEAPAAVPALQAPNLAELVDEIAAAGHGLVMLMGKGGVGKTTLAAAVAVELAHRGLPVHLTTSDPAAHLAETLDGSLDNLTVSRIDPHAATEAYRQHVMATKGASLDEQGKALLAEDLHRRDRRVPGLLAGHPRGRPQIRGHGHRAHRPHPALARCHRRLPPRDPAADERQRHALQHADDAAAGPATDQGAAGHPGGNHPSAGSRQPAGRPAPRRHRALGLGDQQQHRRRPHRLAPAAPAGAQRTRRDRGRGAPACAPPRRGAAARRRADRRAAPAGVEQARQPLTTNGKKYAPRRAARRTPVGNFQVVERSAAAHGLAVRPGAPAGGGCVRPGHGRPPGW
ncbi:Arsenical pump-driving ATPase ArsA [Azotobacter chroococcum NCIMB 8003]|uniref:arsenite-transporting ATPase n=1 Tax=Azotobacter chroococcum NCIMB 8003 TaxID=1328314 RepID=A0A0C4WMH6_9GAMM|nr:Arsenical pump-driving ATPase ArsA [Azotobacter chroococcum NCIMB 8003]